MKKIILHILLIILLDLASLVYAQELNDVKIGIVYSAKTKEMLYPQDKAFYPIQDWELFFLNRKISYTVITDEQLDDNDFDFLDVLILPSVELLSKNSVENLQEFLNDGNGLLIFGKTGIYNEEGEKNFAGFLQNSAGFNIKEINTKGEIAEGHSLPTSSVICRNIKFDKNLIILNQYKPLVVESESKDVKPIGEYVFNEKNKKQFTNSGIALSEKNNGRIVWFGFQLSQILGDKSQEKIIEKLIFNSIEWLSTTPILMFNAFPKENTIPVIISNNISDVTSVSTETLEQFYLKDIRANFFIDANEIKSLRKEILSRFAAAGDLNVYFGSQSSQSEISSIELERMYDRLMFSSSQKYFGLSLMNPQLLKSFEKFPISPFKFITLPDNSLYTSTATKTSNNGYKKIIDTAPIFSIKEDNYEKTLENFSKFYNNASKNKEVAFVNLIDQTNSGTNLYNNSYRAVIDFLKNKNAWITTYSELIKWILMRDNLFITTKRMADKNEFKVIIENRSQYEVKNTEIRLIEPAGMYNPRISKSNLQLDYNSVLKAFSILIPFIRAGTKETFNLRFDERR